MIATPTAPLDAALNNPYNAPGADLSQAPVASAAYAPRFFSRQGRIGRARYFAYLTGAWLLAMGVMIPVGIAIALMPGTMAFATLLPLLILACCVGASVFFVVRRLNDLNQSGWLAPLVLVPFVNIAFGLWLLFAPGTSGVSKYGPAAARNGVGVSLGCVCGIVIIAATLVIIVGELAKTNSGVKGQLQPAAGR